MRTVNVNVVRGRSHKDFQTQKFIIRKFPNTKISRSTVLSGIGLLDFEQAEPSYVVKFNL